MIPSPYLYIFHKVSVPWSLFSAPNVCGLTALSFGTCYPLASSPEPTPLLSLLDNCHGPRILQSPPRCSGLRSRPRPRPRHLSQALQTFCFPTAHIRQISCPGRRQGSLTHALGGRGQPAYSSLSVKHRRANPLGLHDEAIYPDLSSLPSVRIHMAHLYFHAIHHVTTNMIPPAVLTYFLIRLDPWLLPMVCALTKLLFEVESHC